MNEKKAKKIIIVEDDPFIADIYLVELENNGYDVEITKDGQEALEKIKNQKFDLMLLDILMPQKDGFAVLNEIKANPNLDLEVIVLTNLAGDDYIKKAMDLGAKDYIVKTQFTPKEVLRKIKEILK
ncbi:MAG: response regulator [Patescibacteria group bacterium]|nr:response regulator [Patescibacteria group bacterium]